MRLSTRIISILLVLCVSIQLTVIPVPAYDGDACREYSWSEIFDGVLGPDPAINSVEGESEFLSAAGDTEGAEYSSSDVTVRKEKYFWLMSGVRNDNPNDWAAARDVRLKLTIDQKSAKVCVVTAELFSSNASPYHVTDSMTFTASEAFHLEYVKGSSYVYSWPDGSCKSTKADGDAVSDSGILLGHTKLNGVIPGGAYVSSSVRLKVVRKSDKGRLRNTVKGKATVRMWNLVQKQSDPKYFTGPYRSRIVSYSGLGKLKGSKYKKVASIARQQTAGCKTDYEKMKVLCKYIANRTYYDYPYYKRKTKKTNITAYDVWAGKRTICQGYSNLYWTMLYSLGIPCMMVYGDNHAFNAAFDRSSKRWVFVDVTWCSGNSYYGGKKWNKGSFNSSYFDMDLDYILSLSNHEIYGVEGVLRQNVYYSLTPGYGNGGAARFKRTGSWHWTAVCQKKKSSTLKLVARIDKYPVREIGYAAFYGRPDIKTIYIPTSVTRIDKFAFSLKSYRRKVGTKVVTKLPKSKLKLMSGYRWWGRSVKIRR